MAFYHSLSFQSDLTHDFEILARPIEKIVVQKIDKNLAITLWVNAISYVLWRL